MADLSEIKPASKARVIDLVRAAGVDVSAWSNFAGGPMRAATNPKYCYEWAFVEPNKVVVLNLWFDAMKEKNGAIYQELNAREWGVPFRGAKGRGVWASRANALDSAIQTALDEVLPIRVIVCDGKARNKGDPNSAASKVDARILDPVPWAVVTYVRQTGQCILSRGSLPARFVDQFALHELETRFPERRVLTSHSFVRDPKVREFALRRANGRCELCGELGFKLEDGRTYLETHHVVPLFEGGPDSDRNVVALCANHHRHAHYGFDRHSIREKLLEYLEFHNSQ